MNRRAQNFLCVTLPNTVLFIVLSVALTSCDGINIRWKDQSKVHTQTGAGDLTIPNYPIGECGVVSIEAAVADTGVEIEFEFSPNTPPPEGCCESYGWIQHVDRSGSWTFDNGARGQSAGTGVKYGHPSDPSLKTQPVGGPNPWYGGPGNVTDAMDSVPDDWDEDPDPQSTIKDTPACNEGHAFITQLVCVETGEVVFEYRWRLQPRDGECEFHGAEGDNISFDLVE